jgi:hypothetical protein
VEVATAVSHGRAGPEIRINAGSWQRMADPSGGRLLQEPDSEQATTPGRVRPPGGIRSIAGVDRRILKRHELTKLLQNKGGG